VELEEDGLREPHVLDDGVSRAEASDHLDAGEEPAYDADADADPTDGVEE
jgi:hypothetical protein